MKGWGTSGERRVDFRERLAEPRPHRETGEWGLVQVGERARDGPGDGGLGRDEEEDDSREDVSTHRTWRRQGGRKSHKE